MVQSLEHVLESDPIRADEAWSGVADLDVVLAGIQIQSIGGLNRLVVYPRVLDEHRRPVPVDRDGGGIYDRHALLRGEPEPPIPGAAARGLPSPVALRVQQPISLSV